MCLFGEALMQMKRIKTSVGEEASMASGIQVLQDYR